MKKLIFKMNLTRSPSNALGEKKKHTFVGNDVFTFGLQKVRSNKFGCLTIQYLMDCSVHIHILHLKTKTSILLCQ